MVMIHDRGTTARSRPRCCLWMSDCSPAELRKMPECLKRIRAVRDHRLAGTSAGTRKLADKPTRFHVENMPEGNYIIVPEVSSERRRYVPMGFMTPDVMSSNLVKLIPNANLYHFINDIENLMDNILAFMQEHGGWVLIALMLLAVFASYRKKKQDKDDKQRNDED